MTSIFSVQGDDHFPFDMLRYDACWPATTADAMQLPQYLSRTITLMTDGCGPTVRRWESFGWTVNVSVKEE